MNWLYHTVPLEIETMLKKSSNSYAAQVRTLLDATNVSPSVETRFLASMPEWSKGLVLSTLFLHIFLFIGLAG